MRKLRSTTATEERNRPSTPRSRSWWVTVGLALQLCTYSCARVFVKSVFLSHRWTICTTSSSSASPWGLWTASLPNVSSTDWTAWSFWMIKDAVTVLRRAPLHPCAPSLLLSRRGHCGGLPGGQQALPQPVLPQIPAQLTL